MLPKNYRWIDAFTLACSTGCAAYISERRDRRAWIAHVYNSRGRVLRGRHGSLRAAQRGIERWIAAQARRRERQRGMPVVSG